ncbi:MAG TPA: YraN family protein [Moorella mulderi]|nr:YraN family protein [Moorella mulderi]
MKGVRQRRGRKAEEAAASFLETQGYKIIARNFRCPWGELDVVALDGQEVVFVEVRSVTSLVFGPPQGSVDRRKRERLRRLALYFLQQRGWQNRPCRFDVLAVRLDRQERPMYIEHLKGAF